MFPHLTLISNSAAEIKNDYNSNILNLIHINWDVLNMPADNSIDQLVARAILDLELVSLQCDAIKANALCFFRR